MPQDGPQISSSAFYPKVLTALTRPICKLFSGFIFFRLHGREVISPFAFYLVKLDPLSTVAIKKQYIESRLLKNYWKAEIIFSYFSRNTCDLRSAHLLVDLHLKYRLNCLKNACYHRKIYNSATASVQPALPATTTTAKRHVAQPRPQSILLAEFSTGNLSGYFTTFSFTLNQLKTSQHGDVKYKFS